MKLIVAKKEDKLRASFILKSYEGSTFKPLKSGKTFYPFIKSNGDISVFGGLFTNPPSDPTNLAKFRDEADYLYEIELADFGDNTLAGETTNLRGNRLIPTSLVIKKVSEEENKVTIEGNLSDAEDPRLQFLHPSESTEFGQGTFNLSNLKGIYNGDYLYLTISPYAEEVEKIVEEQKRLFNEYSKNPNPKTKEELDKTYKFLSPHANEIYKNDHGIIYFISPEGQWRCQNYYGLRDIDIFDKKSIREYLEDEGIFDSNLDFRKFKENLYKEPLHVRNSLEAVAPIFLKDLLASKDADEESLKKYIETQNKIKPRDWLQDPTPGIKEGVEVIPHQSYILGKTQDVDKDLIDADPGAGKSIIILLDILKQIQIGKVKRPLVIMPNTLLESFAGEVREFTELNPWIINTQSIKNWKDGKLDTFIEDAKSAPINTVFLTSYYWLGYEKENIPNGQIVKIKEEEGEKLVYKTIKTYPRAIKLLKDLGVDAVYKDESHILINDSNRTRATATLSSTKINKGLSGTIMPGNPIDIVGTLSTIHSGIFRRKTFLSKYTENGTPNKYKDGAIKQIRQKLLDYGVPQVRKSAWAHILPKVKENIYYVDFSKNQQKVYDSLLTSTIDEIKKDPKLSKLLEKLEKDLEEGDMDSVENNAILKRFIPLDKFLNAPAQAKEWTEALLKGDDVISPVMDTMVPIIREHLAVPDNGKIIVFTQFKDCAKNLIEHLPSDLEAVSAYYQGGMIDVLTNFKNPKSNTKVLFAVDVSLREGHNLQVANAIINVDFLWTPGGMNQRKARAARIKQTREVTIHEILVNNSAETLKFARLINMQHMIAKANSNFDDTENVPAIGMTLNNMETFREKDKLEPYIDRLVSIRMSEEEQSKEDTEFYGHKPLKPREYLKIADHIVNAKILDNTPSTDNFKGNILSSENMTRKELEDLPDHPKNPKVITFDLQNWDDDWYLTCFRSVDPEGYLRKLNFNLQKDYYFIEIPNKGGASILLNRIENKGINIVNKEDLEHNIQTAKFIKVGKPGIPKLILEEKKAVNAKVAEPTSGVEFHFASLNGKPYLYTDALKEDREEVQKLVGMGFKKEPPFWYHIVTRSSLITILNRIKTQHSKLRVAEWDTFKLFAKKIFNVNLDDFDSLKHAGEK